MFRTDFLKSRFCKQCFILNFLLVDLKLKNNPFLQYSPVFHTKLSCERHLNNKSLTKYHFLGCSRVVWGIVSIWSSPVFRVAEQSLVQGDYHQKQCKYIRNMINMNYSVIRPHTHYKLKTRLKERDCLNLIFFSILQKFFCLP